MPVKRCARWAAKAIAPRTRSEGQRPRVALRRGGEPRGHVPESQQQVDEGGLPAAARPTTATRRPRLELEAHAVEREAGLAGVGEAQVAHLESPRGASSGRARSARRPRESGPWPRRAGAPTPRTTAIARPGRGQAATASNAARVSRVTTARWTPSSASRADGRDREGEYRDRGQVGAEPRERAAERGGADEALLLADGLAAHARDRRGEIGLPPEGQDVRQPLHAVHEPGRELAAQRREAAPRTLPESPSEPGKDRAGHREPGDGRRPPATRRRAAARGPRGPRERSRRG